MSTNKPSGWAMAWTFFAGIMMIMMGVWWLISGFETLFNSKFYISTWGWIHLIIGSVVLLAGIFLLFTGAVWARTVGVIVAVLAALASLAWLPYYPFWSILFIAVSVAVIWALTVHGRDITDA